MPESRDHMVPAQSWFLDQAASLSFRDFDQVVREWERLVDADGAADRNQRNHEARNATLLHPGRVRGRLGESPS